MSKPTIKVISACALLLTFGLFVLISYDVIKLGAILPVPDYRCIFIDLGANRADTFRIFLKEKNTKYKYNFPIPAVRSTKTLRFTYSKRIQHLIWI